VLHIIFVVVKKSYTLYIKGNGKEIKMFSYKKSVTSKGRNGTSNQGQELSGQQKTNSKWQKSLHNGKHLNRQNSPIKRWNKWKNKT
jgi:hypothetical protein